MFMPSFFVNQASLKCYSSRSSKLWNDSHRQSVNSHKFLFQFLFLIGKFLLYMQIFAVFFNSGPLHLLAVAYWLDSTSIYGHRCQNISMCASI